MAMFGGDGLVESQFAPYLCLFVYFAEVGEEVAVEGGYGCILLVFG